MLVHTSWTPSQRLLLAALAPIRAQGHPLKALPKSTQSRYLLRQPRSPRKEVSLFKTQTAKLDAAMAMASVLASPKLKMKKIRWMCEKI